MRSQLDDSSTPVPLGPDSLTWKYFGDWRGMLQGVWAGSMQNMHPGLGAGVEEQGRDVVECWEKTIAAQAIDEAVDFGKLDPASEDEEDMLDLAAGVARTSRLSCQIELTDELDGLEVRIPGESHDMQRR